ncbi:MAG: hypothetical protein P4L99_28695, partial [Chthoniobacter sp.]|nr:hypothetical protein [Chthoniobacter sp.]
FRKRWLYPLSYGDEEVRGFKIRQARSQEPSSANTFNAARRQSPAARFFVRSRARWVDQYAYLKIAA